MRVDDQPLDAYWGERLIRALRSGEYTQCFGTGHDEENGTYCALGVLVAILERDGLATWEHHDTRRREMMAKVMPPWMAHTIVMWNDRRGYDFATIADKLEDFLPPQEPVWTPEAVDAGALAEPDLVAV